MNKKLYLVTCRGMTIPASPTYGVAYVVAEDPGEAYAKVRQALEKRDVGFSSDREMDRIELLAEESEYPACGKVLYI